ncbi:MAG: YvcK family protein [Actinobacteria bacterium]|nr:YvcK family protein [Actinomycetota bacterium]
MTPPSVVLLAGGLGGARLAPALQAALQGSQLTVVANSGDDFTWHGLRVWPDFDSIAYSLAGRWDADRGWGVAGDTFATNDALVELAMPSWFALGDADLALQVLRTELLAAGLTPHEVAAELTLRLGIDDAAVLPAAALPAETHVMLHDGRAVHFQEWYVHEGAEPEVARVQLARGPASPAVLDALEVADVVIFGPCNPVTSVGAILALDGVVEAVKAVPRRIAVSPIVLRRPTEDGGILHHSRARGSVLAAEGWADTPAGVAARWTGLINEFLLDRADEADVPYIRNATPVVAELLDPEALARTLADLVQAEDFGPYGATHQIHTVPV